MTDDEETKDEFVQGEKQVNDDEDKYVSNAEVKDSGKGYAKISDVAKAYAEKIKEIRDDAKKPELPPTSSSLYVSSGFGDQFLKLSSDTSLVNTVKENTDAEINSLLDIKIQSEVLHIQQHDDDDDDDHDPPVRPNQGNKTKKRRTKELESAKKPSTTKETPRLKAPSKGLKSGKSATAKERVKEPIAKVIMDDAVNTTGEDVEHLKTSDRKKTYTTSITKIKATWYEIKGIKYMVPTLWSTIKHAYDKDAKKGVNHWGERGNFADLHLNDIEDMMLLDIHHKLFHLNDNDIVEFIVALCMFTKSLIIKRRIEDLQLGVECYQKKLNITTAIDKKRSELMVKLIDKQMRERRISQNLERLVGARELEMDYKLMPDTV
nr:hypothetical protein [Tanacetum cinerariifolium]